MAAAAHLASVVLSSWRRRNSADDARDPVPEPMQAR
jgi:hypothetical protein